MLSSSDWYSAELPKLYMYIVALLSRILTINPMNEGGICDLLVVPVREEGLSLPGGGCSILFVSFLYVKVSHCSHVVHANGAWLST